MSYWHILILTAALTIPVTGCKPRGVDMEEFDQSYPRDNQGDAPATGLEQNPGRPKSYRPPPVTDE
jgi:hypothetical protein